MGWGVRGGFSDSGQVIYGFSGTGSLIYGEEGMKKKCATNHGVGHPEGDESVGNITVELRPNQPDRCHKRTEKQKPHKTTQKQENSEHESTQRHPRHGHDASLSACWLVFKVLTSVAHVAEAN